jgi:hypothetical protein
MTDQPTTSDIERQEKNHDRKDGKAPVQQGGNPSPAGQDEPRNKDVSKRTI